MNYTLITGASKGIGKAIAVEAANRGMNLLLIARSKDLLEQLAHELSDKNVSVRIFVADLLEENAAQNIFRFAKENSLHINMLVNNAGIGHLGRFAKTGLEMHVSIMRLNMEACVRMTYEFLKTTDRTERRYILNTVSTAAFQPVSALNIYSASKTFMLFFSRSLRYELKRKNVYVTALCPGPTQSEFFGPAQMTELVRKRESVMMSADKVARVGLDAVMKNKSVAIPGFANKVGALLGKIVPHDLVLPVVDRFYK